MKNKIQFLKKTDRTEFSNKLNSLIRILDANKFVDRDWEEFKIFFEQVHTDFFTKMKSSYPDLSSAELKLCALARLDLNIKEASNILSISPESVKTSRYRLRKKIESQRRRKSQSVLNGLLICP